MTLLQSSYNKITSHNNATLFLLIFSVDVISKKESIFVIPELCNVYNETLTQYSNNYKTGI